MISIAYKQHDAFAAFATHSAIHHGLRQKNKIIKNFVKGWKGWQSRQAITFIKNKIQFITY